MYCTTRREVERYSFTWTIEHLHTFLQPEGMGRYIESAKFPPSSKGCKHEWTLVFYLFGDGKTFSKSVEVHLKTYTEVENVFTVQYLLSYQDAKNSEIWQCSEEIMLSSASNQYTLDQVNRKSLLKKIGLEDILKIHAEITFFMERHDGALESFQTKCHGQMESELRLVEDFSAMCLDEKLSDIVIIAKGTEFKAHQNVLSARCPVMAAMLKHDTKERQQKCIEINDIEPDTMGRLLLFMYTSKVDYANTDCAVKILTAADKYCLEDLKDCAGEYLTLDLSTSNALDILNAADLYHMPQLKSRALDFVCKNRSAFGDAKKFSCCLKNPQLLVDVVTRLAVDPKPEKSDD